MARIFWVTCPHCQGRFYCHYEELRHKKVDLFCPYCNRTFQQEESPLIEE